jgi:hypothetical protein
MSLHDLVSNLIGSVNPQVLCQWYQCTGSTGGAGGYRTPTYNLPVAISIQVQQLTAADLAHTNDLNSSVISRKVWCNTILTGIDRAAGLGGDKLVLPDGTFWLVTQILEKWPDWCSAIIIKQVAL